MSERSPISNMFAGVRTVPYYAEITREFGSIPASKNQVTHYSANWEAIGRFVKRVFEGGQK